MTDETESGVLEERARLPELAHPTVSPDGEEVAFYYNGTGRNELHVLDVETRDRERWSDGEVPRNNRWRWRGRPTATGSTSTATRTATSRTTFTPSTGTAPPNPCSSPTGGPASKTSARTARRCWSLRTGTAR